MKKHSKKPHSKYPTLAAFVRSQPLDIPFEELFKLAAKEGISLTFDAWRSARRRMADKGKTAKEAPPTGTKEAPPTGRMFLTFSAFVRAQPLDLPIKDLIELATKEGLKGTRALAHRIRVQMRYRGKARSAPSAAGSGKYRSFSAFVRTLPVSTPVKEVIELAAKEGLKGNRNLIYMVRSSVKKNGQGPTVQTPFPNSATYNSAAMELALLVFDVGLTAARQAVDLIERLGVQEARKVVEKVERFARQRTEEAGARSEFRSLFGLG
jgi:hypothetical protein